MRLVLDVIHEVGLLSEWSLLRPFIRVVFHQGGLSLDLF